MMRRSRRRQQPPASGPRISGAQSSDSPLSQPTFKRLPFSSHVHGAAVARLALSAVVAATVGCGVAALSGWKRGRKTRSKASVGQSPG